MADIKEMNARSGPQQAQALVENHLIETELLRTLLRIRVRQDNHK